MEKLNEPTQVGVITPPANKMSIAIQWFENSAFDAPELKSPQPCIHGAGCVYTKKTADGKVIPAVCGFVHPGEEGKGRALFPKRTITFEHPDGEWVVAQPACVRLIGGALYYERMRMGMPWQGFCAVRGIPFTANKPGVYREPVKRVPIGSSVSAAAPRAVKEAVKPVSAVPTVDQGWPVLGGGGGGGAAVPLPIPHAIVEAEVIAMSAASAGVWQSCGSDYEDDYEDDCDVCGKPVEYCPEHGDHGDERRDWARAKCE